MSGIEGQGGGGYYPTVPAMPGQTIGVTGSPDGSEVIGVAVLRDVLRVAGGERVPIFAFAIEGRELPGEWICHDSRFIPIER